MRVDERWQMNPAEERHTLFQGPVAIVLSALLATVFAVRAVMAGAGLSALSGPAWATIDALIAIAAVLRCFDRVVLTPHGLTIFRVGFPTRLVPSQIHQLALVGAGSSVRLLVQQTTGKSRLLGSRRVGSDGERELRELQMRGMVLWAGQLGALDAAAAAGGAAPVEATPRRCVRPACASYRETVFDDQCLTCGDRTQRVNT